MFFVPVLIPAAVHLFHALAELRQRWTVSDAARTRIVASDKPISAPA
jgi:hypothetical protein